jgi:DNA (cytosine-5)-methyltransferase 1
MTHGSLFSGIGGFDLASEWMGWDNKFHCEWEPFPRSILNYHFPRAISYGDIKETDFTVWRGQIDILTGGFPCQPYSAAGKRLGKQDERHLFPEMLRAVREIQPRWVVGENVRGLVSWNGGLVFEEVQSQLEVEGYSVQPFLLPAASVNAPHKRDRVWFIAYSYDKGRGSEPRNLSEEDGKISERNQDAKPSHSDTLHATDPSSLRRGGGDIRPKTDKEQGNEMGQGFGQHRDGVRSQTQGRSTNVTDTHSKVSQHRDESGAPKGSAITKERVKPFGSPRKWEEFPTQSPVCGGNDGIPRSLDSITFPKWRKESIKAYGNAIVPQVALQIFKAIKEYERQSQR